MQTNSGVIRIPVADPSCKKEGLLKFSLPRTCLTEAEAAPAFYGEDTVAASVPSERLMPPAAPSPLVPGNLGLVDSILNKLGDARNNLSAATRDIEYTEFNIRRTDSDFNRMDWPLRTAERDTAQTDSSGEGRQLDFIMWGARNGLRDTLYGSSNALADNEAAERLLSQAQEELQALTRTLALEPTKYAEVLPLLGQAGQELASGSSAADRTGDKLDDTERRVRESDRALAFSDGYISDIKFDRPGQDVSHSARQLRFSLRDAESKLDDAERQAQRARPEVRTTDTACAQAESLLRTARQRLEEAEAGQNQ